MATLRQKLALAKIAGNGGNVGKAMREAGYTAVTADTPGKLTNSKGFKALVEQYLPDSLLVKVHTEGLAATKVHGSMTEPDQVVPDYPTRHKYLVTGLEIKGHLAHPSEDSSPIQVNILVQQSVEKIYDTTGETDTHSKDSGRP